MNGYGYNNVSANGVKWIVLLIAALIAAAGAILLVASGNVGPKADAQAQQMQAQTRTQEARDQIDTNIHAQMQALQLEQQKQLSTLQLEQQKRLNDQEVEQRQIAFARWQSLLEAGMWIVATGAAAAFLIVACALAFKLFEQARAVRQEAKWNAEARSLQTQILKLERQLQKSQTDLYALGQEANAVDWRALTDRVALIEANATEWRALADRLARVEVSLAAARVWRLDHSENGGHMSRSPARGDARNSSGTRHRRSRQTWK